MILCSQCIHRLVIGKRCCDAPYAVGQSRVAYVVAQLRFLGIDLCYGGFPRVVALAGGKLVGEEHQFIDAAGDVLQQVAGIALQSLAHGDALQVLGSLEGVLAYLGDGVGQDERFEGRAVVEHVFAHPVGLLQVFIHTKFIIGVLCVLHEVGTREVHVGQLSVRRIAVPGVGTHHDAEHAHVDAVHRAVHLQFLVLPVGTTEIAHSTAIHDGGQP